MSSGSHTHTVMLSTVLELQNIGVRTVAKGLNKVLDVVSATTHLQRVKRFHKVYVYYFTRKASVT